MATAPYSGRVFELIHKRCVFVDAVYENGIRIGPQIIDKKGGPQDLQNYKYYPLSDTGGFILAFLLLRVDTDLIKQIYMSEYGLTDPTGESVANADIKTLIDDLKAKGLLKEVAERKKKTHVPPEVKAGEPFLLELPIDFGVGLNQIGGYRIKIPI